jgi:hypothetical protein
MNSQRRIYFSVDRGANCAPTGFEHPSGLDRGEQSGFYAEMVSSYVAIYSEYADQIIEHAESYFRERSRA